jgi:hypothetical protein
MKKRIVKNGQEWQVFVSVPELFLNYELWGGAPVQAIGDIKEREFYFRSRHTEWDFEISNAEKQLPSDVGQEQIFYRSARYKNAGYMPFEEAIDIIENCV